MARKSRALVPACPDAVQISGANLWIGGAVVVFAAHDEAAGDLGGQWWVFAAEGAGQAPPGDRAALDDLQHVHARSIQACLYKSTSSPESVPSRNCPIPIRNGAECVSFSCQHGCPMAAGTQEMEHEKLWQDCRR